MHDCLIEPTDHQEVRMVLPDFRDIDSGHPLERKYSFNSNFLKPWYQAINISIRVNKKLLSLAFSVPAQSADSKGQ